MGWAIPSIGAWKPPLDGAERVPTCSGLVVCYEDQPALATRRSPVKVARRVLVDLRCISTTTIVIPGSFTSGTNHFAHAGKAADGAVVLPTDRLLGLAQGEQFSDTEIV
jgi:hypothetical protein